MKIGLVAEQPENCCGSDVVSCRCYKLVAEAGGSLGTQREGNVLPFEAAA